MASPTPTKRKRISWSDKEVKDLLAIFKEKNIISALDGKRYRNGEILGAVQIEMKALGYNKTVEQIRAKWKALKHLYKDKEYCNRKSGNDRKDGGEWDEELDELLKTRASVKPLEYGVDSIESDNEVQESLQINDMEVIFSNDIDNNIDIAGTSLTVEGPEVCTDTISPIQPSKTQRKTESPEDPYSSAASASTTRSEDEEKQTPVPKKKYTSKKSKKNAELPEDANASDASALPTSSNVEENSTSGMTLKSILKKSKKNDDASDKSKSEYNECPVCLGPVVFPVRTPCGHVFCFLCVKGAARQANKCPMCRQHIPIDFDKNPIILERPVVEILEDGYQWFYEGKNGWWQYEKRTSDEIEQHYKLNVLKFDVLICGTMYTIDLDRSVQYNRDNPYRRRKVKRENANNIAVKGVAGVY